MGKRMGGLVARLYSTKQLQCFCSLGKMKSCCLHLSGQNPQVTENLVETGECYFQSTAPSLVLSYTQTWASL